MALFPIMADTHHIPLTNRHQYYHDLHHHNWNSFSSKPNPLLPSQFGWDPHSANPWHGHGSSEFHSPHVYPESSQRTVLPNTPPIINPSYIPPHSSSSSSSSSSSPSISYHCEPTCSSSSCSSEFNDNPPCHWSASGTLYTIDPPDHEPEPEPEPESTVSPARVKNSAAEIIKVEPDEAEDCFIMELATMSNASQSLAPPTEVPLRATQASNEMRNMMNVFRINPFAMHSAGRGAVPISTCCYPGEAGPLEEEPLVFEFQLELDDLTSEESEQEPYEDRARGDIRLEGRGRGGKPLVFSIEGEVEAAVTTNECQWSSPAMFETTTATATQAWALQYPTCNEEYSIPASTSVTPELPSRRSIRLHGSEYSFYLIIIIIILSRSIITSVFSSKHAIGPRRRGIGKFSLYREQESLCGDESNAVAKTTFGALMV